MVSFLSEQIFILEGRARVKFYVKWALWKICQTFSKTKKFRWRTSVKPYQDNACYKLHAFIGPLLKWVLREAQKPTPPGVYLGAQCHLQNVLPPDCANAPFACFTPMRSFLSLCNTMGIVRRGTCSAAGPTQRTAMRKVRQAIRS